MLLKSILILLPIIEFIIGIILVRHFYTQHKRALRVCKATIENLEASKKKWKIEKEKLQMEIESRNTKLSSLSLHFIQKFELVNELQENIESFKASMPKELAPKFNKLMANTTAFEEVDKEWENFRVYFNDANFGFFDQLKSQYPALSAKDLKMCALLRLNLETKQIAKIIGVSPESAKVTRHRIRKKLGLTGNETIHEFLYKIQQMG
jgi:DNA-binding CsgD family transcriptional regulator